MGIGGGGLCTGTMEKRLQREAAFLLEATSVLSVAVQQWCAA